jgi:hypothetical protein
MDRVYFSAWLRGFTQHNMLASFEKLLKLVPYSRLRPGALLTVQAVSYIEPPLLEHRFDLKPEPAEVIALCREFDNADCSYQLETSWDLLSRDDAGEWKLHPVPISLTLHAPLFESDLGEQILIDFGPDARFLPETDSRPELVAIQSNIRSLLHLTTDIGKNLPLEKKTLWSESGENLAAQLQQALEN